MKQFYRLLLLIFIGLMHQVRAQTDTAVLFLLIQPSIRANGMGGASIGTTANDALAFAFNPAHIGKTALEHNVDIEFYPVKTKWLPNIAPDLRYNAYSFFAGFNFKQLNKQIPISLGLGYSRIFIDLGEQIITDETGPDPIGTFQSTESADILTVGIGFDYFVKASIGLNFKDIDSNLSDVGAGAEKGEGHANGKAYDFGVLISLPLVETISNLTNSSFEILPGFRPIFTPGFGYSTSNIGDELTYVDTAQADPLPRVARVGVSLNGGVSYSDELLKWNVFSFEMLSEAEDILVNRSSMGEINYEGPLGDINFFDNVLLGKGGDQIINKKRIELQLLDLFSLRWGRHNDRSGNVP